MFYVLNVILPDREGVVLVIHCLFSYFYLFVLFKFLSSHRSLLSYENNSHHPVVVHELNMSEHISIPYFKFMAAVLWEFWFPPPLHLSPSFLNYLTPAFQSSSLPCTLALHTLQGCNGVVCQQPFGVMTGIDCLFITWKHLIKFDCIISTLAAIHARAANVICRNPQAAALCEEGGETVSLWGVLGSSGVPELQTNLCILCRPYGYLYSLENWICTEP